MRSLAILGSTGSIGTQTLEVAASCGHRVLALTAHHNIDLLERQGLSSYPGSGSGSNRRRCFGVPAGRHGHSGPGGGGGGSGRSPAAPGGHGGDRPGGHRRPGPHPGSHRHRQAHCPGQQGDLGVRRALGDGPRPGEGGGDRPRGLGALGHLPESPGQPRPGAETDFAHRLWGPLLWLDPGGVGEGHPGPGPSTSQLVHGSESDHRLGHLDEQGAGTAGGHVPLCRSPGEDSNFDPPGEHTPLSGGIL